MLQDILSAIPLGFFLSIMPGAVFFVLLETSVLKGFKAAIAFDLGAITSDVVFILIAYFSSYQVLNKIKDEPALFIFGGLIMLVYGFISLISVTRASKKQLVGNAAKDILKRDYFSLFAKGFLLNFINIGVLAFWLGIIITWGPKLDMNPHRMITFFTAVVIAYFVVDLGKIMLAKQLRSKLTSNNIVKIKKGINLIIIVFGVVLLLQGIFPEEVNKTIDKIEHPVK
ncbi:LysE family transporter [Flavobacterium sp. Sd200]|uniref:LysE family translocator n=1 Tax=Flavobacterium sp. Sd200 TaxID=2692211 RepID=UPI00136FE127|nr:LysE family transporter [Flavobacterium sp. Sd200]MXN92637.1 LysE family transporter [Flavobacterium sp. Sd200]